MEEEREMKQKRKGILLFITMLLIGGLAGAEEPRKDIGLGFFSGYNEERNTVTILASYNEWEFQVEKIEEEFLASISPGSLIEFTFYPDSSGYTVTEIINYKVPTPKEYEKIVADYQQRREKLLQKKKTPSEG